MTPVPWTIKETESGVEITGTDGELVATIPLGESAMSNALLIAAAPKLVNALHDIVFALYHGAGSQQWTDNKERGKAAIIESGREWWG